ncbi:coiled-coil domain-containing protein 22-like isoform X2 [Scophthalmus maximus]|uniref:coiled-coil domain-containing protein 22 isoform X2 n=1 Tax=Scophthalmus maximus TaxID=52904 RepID=UPI0015E11FDE|nr:coiled-coil domain-containing protein 22 isoform X2 [Scophthalmus maximus]XP_035500868.1 coiled-coil domain-containing protein 22 isoform X2 [Scophthalmus maximus]XP_047186972.1 coiled-coil domain-containing protein 22-like isoform X2 [Scophthalmus maximus]XP_047186973.1 coiled-coil domain-containing protein 22-like isoform X2 [Scophthalmus maximus]
MFKHVTGRSRREEVSEEIDSVKQFSSELIVKAVVRCIQVIDPGLGSGLPTSLPPGMSARFRVGMSLAQACQDIGYKGEIGYQTFLYSNEPEIRSLLMCLVEKLPRESAETSDQPTGKSLVLQRAIAAAVQAQLAVPWLPTNCRLPLHVETQSPEALHSFHVLPLSLSHFTKGPGKKQLKETDYQRDTLPPVTAQLSHHASLMVSILEQHTAELSAAQEWDNEWNSQGLLSCLTPQKYRSRKLTRLRKRIKEQLCSAELPSPESAFGGPHSSSDLCELLQVFKGSAPSDHILTKSTHFSHTQKFTFEQVKTTPPAQCYKILFAVSNFCACGLVFLQESASVTSSIPSVHQSESDIQHRQQEELASLQQQFQQLCSNVDQLTADMKHMSVTNAQVLNELKHKELGNSEKEDKMQVKKKTIDLLPDADNNLLKLQALVEASTKRLVNLASQWEKRRAPLMDEHRRLKEICSNRDLESSRKLSEIKSLHDKICVSTVDARKKEDIYKQLVTELENLPRDVSRSAYTQRILEIVSNIKKQKEEITKILADTKELQKEINHLTGKLDRTFAVTDELVFKDAKKDESVRKSYKYLAALHENCNQLIQTIEETGTILREIRDLEEQIETENGNKTVANLERILDDYKSIRQENSALAAKVREG